MNLTVKIKGKLSRIKRKITRFRQPETIILMYHRVRKTTYDPWDICVSETHFAAHLRLLANDYQVCPLEHLGTNSLKKKRRKKKIVITFDDGYLDNYETAVPLLKKWNFPATFFIPAQILNSTNLFWWELVDHIFGSGKELPEQFHVCSGKNNFSRVLSEEIRRSTLPPVGNEWSANRMPPQTARQQLYLDLCDWIKKSPVDEQEKIVNDLATQFHPAGTPPVTGFEKMSPDQIVALSKEGFEIGAHTVRHPSLKFQTREVQQEEISLSKLQLEKLTGKPITAFAYPHGDYDRQSKELVQLSGFSRACTTENRALFDNEDLYTLPRVWVNDCRAKELKQQLIYLFNH